MQAALHGVLQGIKEVDAEPMAASAWRAGQRDGADMAELRRGSRLDHRQLLAAVGPIPAVGCRRGGNAAAPFCAPGEPGDPI